MYAKLSNNQISVYPYSWQQMKFDNPNTSFPQNMNAAELLDYGVVAVQLVDRPSETLTTVVTEGSPINEGGAWKQVWLVSPAPQQEIDQRTEQQATIVRNQRNYLLAQSDWTQVADAPVNKEAWAAYRQELRDISAQSGFPFEVIWPSQPA